MKRRHVATIAAVAVVGALLALLLLWPLAEGVRGAFIDGRGQFTLAYIATVFRNPIYLEGLRNALAIAVLSTTIAGALGVGAALLLHRFDFPGRRLLAALVPLPLMVPPFVGAVGMKYLLGRAGALNALLERIGLGNPHAPIDWLRDGRFAVVVALTALHLYPIVYFNVQAALAGLNPEMEEAARSLGCRGLRLFRKVTLPSILIWGFTELGVPLLCDFQRVTSVQIYTGLKDLGRNPFVYALVVVVLVTTVAMYVLARRLVARAGGHRVGGGKGVRAHRPRRLRPLPGAIAAAALAAMVGVAALPNASVVLLAFARDWYGTVLPSGLTLAHVRAALAHDVVVPSIANSLRYVTLATAFDLVIGTTIAYLVTRARSRAGLVLDAAAMLPLAVPGLVMAFGYLAISREGRPLSFLNPLRDPTALLVIAYAVRRLPFVVEEAAASLGASALSTFRRVTLPLLLPHLMAGAVFAFALSMLEVSDSLILAQRQATYPITKAMYDLFQLLGDGRQVAAALGLWAMLFLLSAIGLARSLLGGKLGNMFRL
jgi:iron(III) transport system permease protein